MQDQNVTRDNNGSKYVRSSQYYNCEFHSKVLFADRTGGIYVHCEWSTNNILTRYSYTETLVTVRKKPTIRMHTVYIPTNHMPTYL